ncbi:hypothetical protein CENSYa_1192 [Cenarchaeum symbiosum A]|uniref:Uncharacterized protein n=1 Tax=Cenarchaeum symbiosum (strain A) TaxID=414004 RepID=A0RWU9_CENSY|nr:hypothetical protein CENSYa_1192 [Cenarchaeum symbiosum A]
MKNLEGSIMPYSDFKCHTSCVEWHESNPGLCALCKKDVAGTQHYTKKGGMVYHAKCCTIYIEKVLGEKDAPPTFPYRYTFKCPLCSHEDSTDSSIKMDTGPQRFICNGCKKVVEAVGKRVK